MIPSYLDGRRGTLSEALTQARDAMNSGRLTPLAAALVDGYRFLVTEQAIDDPDGLEPLTPEMTDACAQLAKFATAARFQADADLERRRKAKAAAKGRKPPKTAEARLKLVKALSEKTKGRRLSKRARATRIHAELGHDPIRHDERGKLTRERGDERT